VIARLGLLLLLATLFAAHPGAAATQTPVPPVDIEVEGNTFRLAPADADAFQRRLNQPPKLEETPDALGASYTVTTPYWDAAVRENGEPSADEVAQYFPQGGFVRASQDGEDVWLVLDLRQRAILDHYVLYGTQQRLPQDPELRQHVLHPSALLVVFLAYYGVGEEVAIEVGDRLLSAEEADAFLASVAPHLIFQLTFLDPPLPPETARGSGYWVTFTLLEGRSLRYFLDTASKTLTDSLGTETFDLSAAAGGGIPESASATQIEQQSPRGSAAWWPLMIGGGIAFLGAGWWLQRKAAD
jgi:hypothetical protein